MEIIMNSWPWYVTGPLIATVMALLLYFGKTFGMSSNLRTFCAIGGAGKYADFFKINWKDYKWSLAVVLGAAIGGYLAVNVITNNQPIDLNPKAVAELEQLGFSNAGKDLLPSELFASDVMFEPKNLILLIIGGLLVGFGTRYAGGCTSGHAITGLSSLQLPSLIAVIGIFAGGLIMVNILLPLIFGA